MITIIDYGIGNLSSIRNMLSKAGFNSIISGRPEDIADASKILLPGMGAFDNCMEKLDQSGLRPLIEKRVLIEKIAVLGICVGLQMFMQSSEEGLLQGLGWIKGNTIRFRQDRMQEERKIPNMGWLDVQFKRASPLLKGLEGSRFYFAHSYHVELKESSDELISANYGYEYAVAIEHENIMGVQFHPEKSHRFGMQLLKNFAMLD
ncbi:MAG TPA: imidazole glycerol phosphate synthase subunit HisH [Nitrosopumilaceae archaeon]|nr:imidazole glycerol phosphate synthase subunit HisH [Nitrosopumilaceae archaeon]